MDAPAHPTPFCFQRRAIGRCNAMVVVSSRTAEKRNRMRDRVAINRQPLAGPLAGFFDFG